MALGSAGQFKGNEAEAAKYLRQKTGEEPSSGMIRYLAYGSEASGNDAARLGLTGSAQGVSTSLTSPTSFTSTPAPTIAGVSLATPNFEDILKQAMSMQTQAAQPAVASYQASIPETQAKYTQERTRLEAEKEPLEKRYQNLLSQVTGQQQAETQRTSIATARELGKRGITPSSGLYEQTINEALSPISRYYTGQISNIGLSQEESQRQLQNLISGIPTQETEATRAINNAIASLQAGAGQTGVQQALSLLQQQQGAQQSAASLALQQQTAQAQEQRLSQEAATKTAEAAWKQPYEQRLYEYQLGKPYFEPEPTVLDIESLWNEYKKLMGR